MKRNVSQRQINTIMIIAIMIAILMALDSAIYMRNCLDKEKIVEQKKNQFEQISGTLLEASNYLTDEARKFTITANMEHLHNYWDEIDTIKRRDRSIEALEKLELPDKVKRYLNVAKENSDLLVYTETRAMRLIADTINVNEDALPEEVHTYILNVVEKDLNNEQKRMEAIQLLLNDEYSYKKGTIIDNIQEFRTEMSGVLLSELEEARQGTRTAIHMHIAFLCIIFILIMAVLAMFYAYVIDPLNTYSKKLQSIGKEERKPLELKGSKELQVFAEVFNNVYAQMLDDNKAKNDFLAFMSHEIRTPLSSMIGYIFLLNRTPLTMEQKKYVTIIKQASESLLQTINDTLDVMKLRNKKYKVDYVDFNIRMLLEQIEDVFSYQADTKKLTFKMHVDDQVPLCLNGDSTKLKQIISNLVSNALKFTKVGGVKVFVLPIKPLEGYRNDRIWLSIQVEDSGIGIRKKNLDRIFESFEQTNASTTRNYGGTGLGLTITKEMVELLEGNIIVSSMYGFGSVFNVHLPFLIGNETAVAYEQKAVELKSYDGNRVMVVEDNKINQTMEEEILKLFQLDITVANSGEEAVDLAQRQDYDLIFMDIRMDGIDGYEASRRIRKVGLNKQTTIIALTANTLQDATDELIAAGINDCLNKPFQIERLAAMLEHYLIPKNTAQKLALEDSKTKQRALVEQLRKDFVKRHNQDFEQLSDLAEHNRWKELADLLHQLKGVTKTLKYEELGHVLEDFEKEVTAGHRDINGYLIKTKQYYEIIKQQQTLKENKQQVSASTVQLLDEQQKDIKKVLEQLKAQLSCADIMAADTFVNNSEQIKIGLPSKDYEALAEAMNHYDFEKAGEICTRYCL